MSPSDTTPIAQFAARPRAAAPFAPPVEARQRRLPLEDMPWELFEDLCLELAGAVAPVEFFRAYGNPGDDQGGIDLYARRHGSDRYFTFQCKREKQFGPAKIKEAVEEFLAGPFANTSETFTLCSSRGLRSRLQSDEIERQRELLRGRKITFEVWDAEVIGRMLRTQRHLVEQFFSAEWAKSFCTGVDGAAVDREHEARAGQPQEGQPTHRRGMLWLPGVVAVALALAAVFAVRSRPADPVPVPAPPPTPVLLVTPSFKVIEPKGATRVEIKFSVENVSNRESSGDVLRVEVRPAPAGIEIRPRDIEEGEIRSGPMVMITGEQTAFPTPEGHVTLMRLPAITPRGAPLRFTALIDTPRSLYQMKINIVPLGEVQHLLKVPHMVHDLPPPDSGITFVIISREADAGEWCLPPRCYRKAPPLLPLPPPRPLPPAYRSCTATLTYVLDYASRQ